MNGASVAAIDATSAGRPVRTEDTEVQAVAMMNAGMVAVRAIALAVARGEKPAEEGWAQIQSLGATKN
jgi:hypothetical protein